jgi:hypothetical protein
MEKLLHYKQFREWRVRETDSTHSPPMYVLNGWLVYLLCPLSICRINIKNNDKVNLNKAKLKEPNINTESSPISKNKLFLWQRNEHIYCSVNPKTDNNT